MSSVIQKLFNRCLIHPPRFLPGNIVFEAIMGSSAYGLAIESSDTDIYGFAIPPRNILFPHLDGFIPGFGKQPQKFDQFQQHHIKDKESGKEYDVVILNIVRFFELARQGNPNIIDCLFTPDTSIIHSTAVGNLVRENRRVFLSKKCYARYKGYSYSMLKKMVNCSDSYEIDRIVSFEKDYNISRKTKFNEVENEMNRRGLLKD